MKLCQTFLSIASLRSSIVSFPVQAAILFKYVVLCRPLSLFPAIFPVRNKLSKPPFLIQWPKKSSCCFLMASKKTRCLPALSRTAVFVVWLVQGILIIRLRNHISAACKRSSISLEIVQLSHPCFRVGVHNSASLVFKVIFKLQRKSLLQLLLFSS